MSIQKINESIYKVSLYPYDALCCYLIEDHKGELTLIDTGIKGSWVKIAASLKRLGKDPADIRNIVVSHAHLDHVGSLENTLNFSETNKAKVHSHDIESSFIEEGKAPAGQASFIAKVLNSLVPAYRAVNVSFKFNDNDVLDAGGGLRVLHTPGHTPGHCSFIHEPTKTLITGDAITNFFSRICYPFKAFCSDFNLTKQSVERLGDANYESALFMHGSPILENAREKIRKFIALRIKELS